MEMIYTKSVWINKKSFYKKVLKKIKKAVDKSIMLMYNHFCVTPKDVIEYW